MIKDILLTELQPSPMNPYNAYPSDKMNELINSISRNGQLEPLIVRPAECCETYSLEAGYEIIAGHNRYQALIDLGSETAICDIVRVDDVTASIIIGHSNIQRDISEIETARSYRQTYELMKKSRGGDRKSEDFKEKSAAARVGSGIHDENMVSDQERTLRTLADLYGIAASTMYRKIRLTYLIPEVLDKYEKKKITQRQAVQISFADDDMQMALMDNYSSTDRNWLTDEKADAFGSAARKSGGHITPNEIRRIMNMDVRDSKGDSNRQDREKKYLVPANLFPIGLKKKDRSGYLVKALEYIRNNNIVLE